MRDNPYKDLPPLERRPDGSLYRMTPAQKKQAASLIRRECCCCEDGNCIVLDDGDACTCPQTVSFSVCCKWFRWAVLPLDGTLKAEIFRDKDMKRCAVCGGVFVPKIKTTRPTGGLLQGYKPMLPASASRRWLSLCSSLLPLPLSPPLKGCLYYSPPLKGSSYSRTLNLSSAISCFSWSSMYFLMVASFRPTVLT